jgi:hypothetical protein
MHPYYPSIYTHSIPWALHTKITAKAKRHDKKLLGNRLDALVRKTQHDQTIGIPIGPDSSVIIAEIIGTEIDRYLRDKIPDLVGYRYVDDMYFYFDDQAKAEICLKEIQHIFKELELQINIEKTSIKNLPCGIEDEWVIALRTFVIRQSQRVQFRLSLYHCSLEHG